ncbi:hypothetical protein ATO10_02395 [Actibacterium atlanticum]|uniref:Outer membrane protein beta-barrel domain-containing protein n=1 Tax=Actibacterium atlanticum TaxID=1461693 RepID=A0A058ZPR9_9RHOB|nr:outer membrane beta-barrel protein [Actibacterium atlanticum]KCV83573.1 hypothetical protein ATO10_02395 [Actibacterium atlanticum]
MKTMITAAALSLAALPAVAGSADPAPADPAVTQAAPAFGAGGDWTGAYGGLSLGYGDFDGAAGQNADGTVGGIFAGYDWDLGDWVVGGALEYSASDANFPGTTGVDAIGRLKLRAGYDLGKTLVYGTVGAARANIDLGGGDAWDNGYFVGFGAEHFLTESVTVGGELTYDRFDNFANTTTDVDGLSATARVALRF